jgi:hypothetical protein
MNNTTQIKIENHVAELTYKFTQLAEMCQDDLEYSELITAVVAFQTIILHSFRQLCLEDTSEILAEEMVTAIKNSGQIVANEVIDRVTTSENKTSFLN